jgi:NADH:ubiquinone oxidoreductase subunit 4 (subunit M)
MAGLFLGGWYTMTLIQESFSGTPETEETVPVKPRQLVVLGSLAAVVLWLGLSPQFVLETSGPEIKLLEQRHPAPATPVASAVVPGSAPRTIAE